MNNLHVLDELGAGTRRTQSDRFAVHLAGGSTGVVRLFTTRFARVSETSASAP